MTSLKVNSQSVTKGGVENSGTGYISRPYLGKPQPSQLAPGTDGSLDHDLDAGIARISAIIRKIALN